MLPCMEPKAHQEIIIICIKALLAGTSYGSKIINLKAMIYNRCKATMLCTSFRLAMHRPSVSYITCITPDYSVHTMQSARPCNMYPLYLIMHHWTVLISDICTPGH